MMPFTLPTLPGYFGLSWQHAQTTGDQKIQIYSEEYSPSVPEPIAAMKEWMLLTTLSLIHGKWREYLWLKI
jgi:hypothetical protein